MSRGTPLLKGWYIRMAERPISFPDEARGEGSWGYDPARRKITLRHYWLREAPWIERGETIEECERKRTRRRRDLSQRAGLKGDGTVGGWFAAWREHEAEGKDENTLVGYDWSIKHFERELGAETSTWDLSVGAVETMWTTLSRRLGVASMRKLGGHWCMALAFAGRRKLIPTEIKAELVDAKFATLGPLDPEQTWHELEDYRKVRERLVRNHRARDVLVLVMMLCGLRPGEALGLKWCYVDLDARTIRVEGQWKRRGGFWTTVLKTDHRHDKAHRTVPIPADLVVLLRAMLAAAKPGEEFVFIEDAPRALHRGRLVRFDAIHDHVTKVASDLRIPYVNPKGYRHTFASVCLWNGMRPEELAVLMGHINTGQIIRTYGHAIAKPAAPDMDRYLGTPQG